LNVSRQGLEIFILHFLLFRLKQKPNKTKQNKDQAEEICLFYADIEHTMTESRFNDYAYSEDLNPIVSCM